MRTFVNHAITTLATIALSLAYLGLHADSAEAANNSQFVSQTTLPTSMTAGETRQVSITFKNTGTTTWTRAGLFKIGSRNPADNTHWGMSRVLLDPTDSIAPTQQKTFTFTITAPSNPGLYNFQWQTLEEGVNWFGASSANQQVQVGGAINDSLFLSQSVASTMTTGETRQVSVTFKNTGNTTWTQAGLFKLGSRNPGDNTTWGMSRVNLGSGDSIGPNSQKTFTFNVIAPTVPGYYNFQWQMLQEGVNWFGPSSANVVIHVVGVNASQFVSQSVPATMDAGETRQVSVTFKNTGTTTWTRSGNFKLGSRNPADNTFWGMSRVLLSATDSIAPTQQKTFTFNVTAPTNPGPYNFQWRMLEEGVNWFGANSQNVIVQVGSGVNGSQFVSQSVPSTMTPGETRQVSVTFKNTGTSTWTAADFFRLGSRNPGDNTTWGMSRVLLDSTDSIAPTQQKTFTFNVTAPTESGSYNFQWQMLREGVNWFGPQSTNKVISVRRPVPRIDSISPQRVDLGTTANLVVRGVNLRNDNLLIPTYDDGITVAPAVTSITVTNGGTRAVVRIDARNPLNEGIWMVAARNADAETTDDVTGIDFRIVPEGPVIDAWTPSRPLSGGVSALVIAGVNLEGANVFSMTPGVRVTDLDNSDDDALSGFLSVIPGLDPQTVELIVENDGVCVHLEPEIIEPFQMPSTHRMVCNDPPVFLQDMVSNMPTRVPTASKLESSPNPLYGGPCQFTVGRQLFRRTFAIRLDLLDENGDDDPNVLMGLGVGDSRTFGVLTVLISARVFVSVSFDFCGSNRFQICVTGYAGVEIPGIQGFVTEFNCCIPGGCLRPRVQSTISSVSSVSFSSSDGTCIGLTPSTNAGDGGRQFVDISIFDCCTPSPTINQSMSGTAFNGSFLSTPFQIINQTITRLIFGQMCEVNPARIVLDPGHGGTDPGNIGPAGTEEADHVLRIALRARDILNTYGYSVTMTRDTDVFVPLTNRPNIAMTREADAFVSIHLNGAAPCPGVNGTETYYHANAGLDSQILATSVQYFLLAATALRDRGVRTTGTVGVNNSGFVVLRPHLHHTGTAACLAEISFLCDPDEETRLSGDIVYEIGLATALAEAIDTYLQIPTIP